MGFVDAKIYCRISKALNPFKKDYAVDLRSQYRSCDLAPDLGLTGWIISLN